MSDTHSPAIPLNFSEHAYVAFDGFMGSMPQVYLIRFDQPVSRDKARSVARELISSQERMRAVIEPGWWRYQLRIMADDHIVDQLFEQAWADSPHLDARDDAQLEALQMRLLNDVLPLEHGLSCRFHFIPHERTPVLFLTVHHVLGDGRTMVHLLTEIMRRINDGEPMAYQKAEGPSMLGGLTPQSWWQLPVHIWRSRGHVVRQKAEHARLHIQQFQTMDQPRMSTHALRHFTVSTPASVLRQAARQMDMSVNSLIVLALCETYLSMAPDDPQAAAVIRMSVDLRRFHPKEAGHGPMWGNHVGAFLVTETGRKAIKDRVTSVKAQIEEGLARFERREMLWTYLIFEILPWLGRAALGHIVTVMQRKLRHMPISLHATSLGNVSHLNPPHATIKIDHLVATVPSMAALQVITEINDRIVMPLIWQRAEASVEQADAYLRRFDEVLARISSASCGSS